MPADYNPPTTSSRSLCERAPGKYLYCIIKEKKAKNFEVKGIEGKKVYNVCEGKLSGVVSDSEAKEYFLTRENVMAHQKVIEEIFKEYNVLPVSFGTVAAGEKDLKERILRSKAEEFLTALRETEGKVELGLKASWLNMKTIFQEIAAVSQTIQGLKRSKNISYQEKIQAGELVSKFLEEKRETEKEKILAPLRKIADDFQENKILGEDMILNAAFLVKKKKEKEFDKVVRALEGKYGKIIRFRYIGPLPPFNFIKLSLKIRT